MKIAQEAVKIDPKMAMYILIQRAQQDKRLAMAMRADISNMFYSDIVNRARTNRNIIISWYGTQGSGKSLAGFYIDLLWSRHSGTEFGIDNVAFTNDELMKKFGELKQGVIYHRDEQVDIFGIGSEREEQAVESVGAVARAQKLSLIYCSPNLKLHKTHYIIEATGIIVEEKGMSMHIVYEGSSEKPIGRIWTKLPQLPDKFWSQYGKVKDAFISAVRRQEPVDRTAEYETIAEDFVNKFVEKGMQFSSKKQLITKLMQEYKKNYTRDEWVSILHLIDFKCKDRKLTPYSFANGDNW